MLGTNIYKRDVFKLKLPYPVKAHPPGKGLYIGFNELQFPDYQAVYIFDHVVPKRVYDGLKIYVHDPYEVVSDNALVRHAKQRSSSKYSIVPKVTIVDESVADFDIKE